jgi:hypothetical protein
MSYKNTHTSRKGGLGEAIISKFIRDNGYIPYIPDAEKAHPFDKFIASPDKKRICIVEVKSKARRNYYPDTGIDQKHYLEYKYIESRYNVPVLLFFVDEFLQKIYGHNLTHLEKERNILYLYQTESSDKISKRRLTYPLLSKNEIRYFLITEMVIIKELSPAQARQLRNNNTRRYSFNLPKNECVFYLDSRQKPESLKQHTLLNFKKNLLKKEVPKRRSLMYSETIQKTLFDYKTPLPEAAKSE